MRLRRSWLCLPRFIGFNPGGDVLHRLDGLVVIKVAEVIEGILDAEKIGRSDDNVSIRISA
jgi:hypothetical protein